MKVTSPDGQVWRVTRRWVPWRARRRRPDRDEPDLGSVLSADDLSGVLFVLAVGLVLTLFPVLFVGPALVLEFFVVLFLVPFAALTRVAFGRHWTVEARRGWRVVWEQPAGDWRTSGLRITEVAEEIQQGTMPMSEPTAT